ncbi:MAG: diacylglycerol/lipid kinase family protein [Betaproteobacteria bacterium]
MAVTIIINPVSGGGNAGVGRQRAEMAAAVAAAHGEPAEVFVTERAGHARDLARRAVRRRSRIIVAWGGDGTINEVASALAFEDVPLGIVPAGSGNGLARELKLDRRPARALAAALAAGRRPMDVGEMGDRLFVNVAGVGLDACVADAFNAASNRRRGFARYAAITVRTLIRYRPGRYTITTPEGETSIRAVFVTVANSPQFGNGVCVAPGAVVDDGWLDLATFEERSRTATIAQIPRLFNRTLTRAPGFALRRIRQATIECEKPMVFHVDGEPVRGGTRLQVRVHPGALQIAV